jgi:hypothetical protein
MPKPLSDQRNQGSVPPRPGRLDRLSSVRAEMAKLYRAAKTGRRDAREATSLIWMLNSIRGALEAEAIERAEEKMAELTKRLPR